MILKLERMDRESGLCYTDICYVFINSDQIEAFNARTDSSTDVTLASGGRYLVGIPAADLAAAIDPEGACPDPTNCSYVGHYLAYGGPDLTHGGFHAAERLGAQHFDRCRVYESGRQCSACTGWEQRLRA